MNGSFFTRIVPKSASKMSRPSTTTTLLLGMLDAVSPQRLEGEHGRAQRLVADELVAPRDREDAAGV